MKKSIIPSIILYVIAGLLAIFAVWGFIRGTRIVSDAVLAGQLNVRGSLYDIISFYMSSYVQYLIYALLMAAAGLILQRQRPAPASDESCANGICGDEPEPACGDEPDRLSDETEPADGDEPDWLSDETESADGDKPEDKLL